MVMILDDWHWVDEASESALAHPLSALSQEPVLLVVAYRPQEFFPRWTPIMERTSIVLSSLSGPQTTELIHNHLGVKVLPVGLADKIQDRTSGNPLFIEEILRSLKESGALRIVEGEGRLTPSLDDLNLPSSVQSVIRSRLDRLDPESQEFMRVASVIGREFNVGPLTGAYTGSGDLETGLDRLCRHDVIQAVQGSEPTFVFNHVLTRMVVYEPLLIKRRRELHRRVAEALEVQHGESLENYYDDLAHHYQTSNRVEKAVYYLERAGRKAAQCFSLVEARRHYRATILLLDSLLQGPETSGKRFDLSLKFAQVSYFGHSEEPLAMLETSLAYARELGDEGRLWKVLYSMCAVQFVLGNVNVAQERFRETVAIGQARADDRLLGLGHAIIGRVK